MPVGRRILLQLSFQTIPECLVHNLLHSALHTVQGHRRDCYYSKKGLAQRQRLKGLLLHVIRLSPPLRKLCRFDLKFMVDHYFMGQSHVGDSFGCLHQLLHRDKPGRAGCEGRKYTLKKTKLHIRVYFPPKARNQNILTVKKTDLFHGQLTGFGLICKQSALSCSSKWI